PGRQREQREQRDGAGGAARQPPWNRVRDGPHAHQSGLKLMRRLRSKSAGSGGGGSGEARYTAASIDSRTAGSPLHSPMLTWVTSPPGTWVTFNTHDIPARAVGGRSHARLILAAICASQLASAALERSTLAFSSVARLRFNSASRSLVSCASARRRRASAARLRASAASRACS